MPWWGALLLSLAGMVALSVTVSIAAALRVTAHGASFDAAVDQVAADPLALGLIQAAAYGLAIVAGLVLFQRGVSTRVALGVRPVRLATLGLAVVAGLALQLPLAEVGNIAQELFPVPMEEQLRQHRLVTPDSALDALAILFAVVVVAPATEELLFRGLVLKGLRESYGPGFALGLSSILFGLVHGHPVAVVYATLAGLVLGAIALRTGSTLPALVVHASVNAMPVLLPARVLPIDGFNTLGTDVYHLPLAVLLPAIAVAAAALYGMTRLERA